MVADEGGGHAAGRHAERLDGEGTDDQEEHDKCHRRCEAGRDRASDNEPVTAATGTEARGCPWD